ncbi:hypothetical protein lerEdw1_003189 [Lerista edwardsae]|nr:hypothetical protein lerEdw1_003189 [Lerista edwardsae]
MYRIQLSGGEIQSSRSNSVNVTRAESPLPPHLSLLPQYPIYILGEGVILTCSAPAGLVLAKYTFYQEGGGQALGVQSKNPSFKLDGRTAGNYYCTYWTWVSGREIQSLKSNSVSVARTECPQPPTLSLHPQHPIYIQGEEVTLICSAPAQTDLTGSIFWEERGSQTFLRQAKKRSSTFTLDGTSAGWFYCMYWIQVSGREVESSRSNDVNVARIERPRAPTLSLQPQHPIYIQGERVTLMCSAPAWTDVTGYTFWEEGGDRILQPHPKTPNNTFALDGTLSQLFYCMYWIRVSRREIESSLSNSVNVARTDPLQPPELEIDPLSGAVNEGEPLLISCLANRSNTEKQFHFYKDGVEIDSSNDGPSEPGDPSHDATLQIPQANSSHSGEFGCSFEEYVGSRWISSPWSQTVNVQVLAQDSSLPALVSMCFAPLLLILVISLACYYCWRRRKASKGQEEFQPQQNQEEMGNLGKLAPQVAASQPQSEVRLNRLKPVEEEEVSYSEIQFRAPHGLNSLNPAGEDGVTYSVIQVQPTHRAAK